ncbi:MAG TPA: hypothetical protein VFF06_27380 [Polyangia bacterium]|nr:hypothetical protein [Polyangia bacterium]
MLIASIGETRAQDHTSASATGNIPLDGSQNAPGKAEPVYKLPSVKVNKRLTVTGAKVTQRCTFTNDGDTPQTFLYCNMIGLNSKSPDITVPNTCNITYDKTAKKYSCAPSPQPPPMRMIKEGYHFGCVQITNLTKGTPQSPADAMGENPMFGGHDSKDFDVSYADVFDMNNGETFDAASCMTNNCFGPNKYINAGADIDPASMAGWWVEYQIPVTDPFVAWQELNGTMHVAEYAGYDQPLSLPSAFPETVAGLGRASTAAPPLSYGIDMNIWDLFTMSAPPTQTQLVNITPYYDASSGVTVKAVPSMTEVVGGAMPIGDLAITRPSAGVPEGTSIFLGTVFSDPVNPTVSLWQQEGYLLQDTTPPTVSAHSESFDSSDNLNASVTATDATAGPLAANFWYTLDNGASWTPVPLSSSADFSTAPKTVTFTGTTSLKRAPFYYFYNVQDAVQNQVFYGVGHGGSTGCACQLGRPAQPPALYVIISLCLSIGLLRRAQRRRTNATASSVRLSK